MRAAPAPPMPIKDSPHYRLDMFLQSGDLRYIERGIQFHKSASFASYVCCLGHATNFLCLCVPGCFCPVGVWCPHTFNKDGFDLTVRSLRSPLPSSSPAATPLRPTTPTRSAQPPAKPPAPAARRASRPPAQPPTRYFPARPRLLPAGVSPGTQQLTQDALVYRSASNDCCFSIATTEKTVPLDKIQDVQLRTSAGATFCINFVLTYNSLAPPTRQRCVGRGETLTGNPPRPAQAAACRCST